MNIFTHTHTHIYIYIYIDNLVTKKEPSKYLNLTEFNSIHYILFSYYIIYIIYDRDYLYLKTHTFTHPNIIQ